MIYRRFWTPLDTLVPEESGTNVKYLARTLGHTGVFNIGGMRWQAAAIFSLTEQKPQAGTSCVQLDLELLPKPKVVNLRATSLGMISTIHL